MVCAIIKHKWKIPFSCVTVDKLCSFMSKFLIPHILIILSVMTHFQSCEAPKGEPVTCFNYSITVKFALAIF